MRTNRILIIIISLLLFMGCKTYHEKINTIENNKKIGNWVEYRDKGKRIILSSYSKGELDGRYLEYNENGLLSIIGKYMNGHKHGTWKTYDYSGRLSSKIRYKKGEVVKIHLVHKAW